MNSILKEDYKTFQQHQYLDKSIIARPINWRKSQSVKLLLQLYWATLWLSGFDANLVKVIYLYQWQKILVYLYLNRNNDHWYSVTITIKLSDLFYHWMNLTYSIAAKLNYKLQHARVPEYFFCNSCIWTISWSFSSAHTLASCSCVCLNCDIIPSETIKIIDANCEIFGFRKQPS